MTKKRRMKQARPILDDDTAPSQYRAQHKPTPDHVGPTIDRVRNVEGAEQQIVDTEGRAGAPYRAYDVLGSLKRNRSITTDQFDAGRKFEMNFRVAGIDPLRAADLERVVGFPGSDDVEGQVKAKQFVNQSIKALGGIGSPGGSVVWHVLGLGQSLKEFAHGTTFISERSAQGMLVGALGTLAGRG